MTTCAVCGRELAADFAFCPACGAPAGAARRESEQRKTVTVVFCDVTGSTALGERIDPEPLRELLAEYFERMRAIVEHHGGTVEKFVGDAVMAIFGVPVLHEDDALRAVRAASEMLAAVGELGLQIRVGVNTGEVVTGTVERLATGDAVNVAARLEQAAAPGEALLGAETVRLARDAISVEPVEPLALKGKREPVPAFRLLSVSGEAVRRRLDLPLVGRVRELRLLREAYEIAASERSCHLFTLLGAAGVGKTRLAQEFTTTVDARVVVGRCLSYGEGITYAPVVAVLKQLGHGDLEDLLATSVDEIAYRARKLLEEAAGERPLVVVWEDVHWAEPAFLDLVEHVADWSRGAPLLLLCLGRPELLDRRAGWGGGKLNATTLLLEALPAADAESLVDRLAPALEADLRRRILDSADGNPLFVEEMVAMLEEAGDAFPVIVPPTVQALLAARIDQLRGDERAALECGSVEGQLFHRSGVLALAGGRDEVSAHLLGLVRKELVRPAPPLFPGEDAFRFRHMLIRDAAYEALPKARRAELHERFADWLGTHGASLVEYDEIAGYHLEQAHAYGLELGRPRPELGRRAAAHLAAAGRATVDRLDVHAAVALLSRAAVLLDAGEPLRREVVVGLAEAQFDAGDRAAAETAAAEAGELARRAGDAHVAARAELVRLAAATQWGGPGARTELILAALDGLADEARRRRDDRVVGAARTLAGSALFGVGDCEGCSRACEEAFEAAMRIGDRRIAAAAADMWVGAVRFGPSTVAEGLAFFARLESRLPLAGFGLLCRGELAALGGDLEQGRADARKALVFAEERGLRLARGGFTAGAGAIELRAGNAAAAERILRDGWDRLAALGETAYRSSVGGALAQALVELGRLEEAEAVALEALGLAEDDDAESQSRARAGRARVLARRGAHGDALLLVVEARRLIDGTDFLDERGDIGAAHAEVLALAGRTGEAHEVLGEALSLYERKGAVVAAQAARRMLDAVTVPSG